MSFDLLFDSPTFDIPTVAQFERDWRNVPTPTVRKIVAREHQFLFFQARLLDQLRHTTPGNAGSPPSAHALGLNLRAGFVKTALLLVASICEAVLRDHAESRGYSFPANRQRTFGVVLQVWRGKADVRPIYADLEALKQ